MEDQSSDFPMTLSAGQLDLIDAEVRKANQRFGGLIRGPRLTWLECILFMPTLTLCLISPVLLIVPFDREVFQLFWDALGAEVTAIAAALALVIAFRVLAWEHARSLLAWAKSSGFLERLRHGEVDGDLPRMHTPALLRCLRGERHHSGLRDRVCLAAYVAAYDLGWFARPRRIYLRPAWIVSALFVVVVVLGTWLYSVSLRSFISNSESVTGRHPYQFVYLWNAAYESCLSSMFFLGLCAQHYFSLYRRFTSEGLVALLKQLSGHPPQRPAELPPSKFASMVNG